MKSTILSKLFVVTLFVCLSVKYASSLKCYECDNNVVITSCQKLNTSMIRTCPETVKPVCRTLKAKSQGFTYIRRSCGILSFENLEEFTTPAGIRQFNLGIAVSSTVCNSDLCNGAAEYLSSKVIVFISAITSLIFMVTV